MTTLINKTLSKGEFGRNITSTDTEVRMAQLERSLILLAHVASRALCQ